MDVATHREWLSSFRRDLHRRPEPAWCEFYTTARILAELQELPTDDIVFGRDLFATGERSAVPPSDVLDDWLTRARETDVEIPDELAGGFTGAMATLECGEGPTVALRVDIDGLPREEATAGTHRPAAQGYRSVHDGFMHACGHDAHAAIGLGVLRTVADSEFEGTLKVIFQPAEERIGGGKPVAESGHLDDVDALFVVHVGLDHPTGEVVAGIDGFLAVAQFDATFAGESAHAGGQPNQGRNAVQAMATAVTNLYAIPRHEDGATRVNAGRVGGGTASNVVPEDAFIDGEVRGETTALMEYTRDEASRVIRRAAAMYDCEAEISWTGEAPSATSDQALVDCVADVARESSRVESIVPRDDLGGSEDATYLMQHVQEAGGRATYVGIGTDHPGGHHTATFDVDEESLLVGVEVLTGAICGVADREP